MHHLGISMIVLGIGVGWVWAGWLSGRLQRRAYARDFPNLTWGEGDEVFWRTMMVAGPIGLIATVITLWVDHMGAKRETQKRSWFE